MSYLKLGFTQSMVKNSNRDLEKRSLIYYLLVGVSREALIKNNDPDIVLLDQIVETTTIQEISIDNEGRKEGTICIPINSYVLRVSKRAENFHPSVVFGMSPNMLTYHGIQHDQQPVDNFLS